MGRLPHTALAASAASAASGGETGGKAHTCSNRGCGAKLHRSEALICQDDPGYDWRGTLFILCWMCAVAKNMYQDTAEQKRKFKRDANAGWRSRDEATHTDYHKRARCVNFEMAAQSLHADYPEASKAEVRVKLLSSFQTWTEKLQLAFGNMDSSARTRLRATFWKWDRDLEARASSDSYMRIAVAQDASEYLTNVCKSVDEFFLCRSCGFISGDWCHNHTHFRCTMCTVQYRPFSMKGSRVPASKALIFSDLTPEQLKRRGPSRVSTGDGSEVDVVLTNWPDTSSEAVLAELKLEAHGLLTDLATYINSNGDEGVQKELERLQRMTKPRYLRRFTMSKGNEKWFDDLNTSGKNREKPFSYEHLREGSDIVMYGLEYQYDPAQDVVMDYKDTIRMLGLTRWLFEKPARL